VVELEFVGSLQKTVAKRKATVPLEAEIALSDLLADLEQRYGIRLSRAAHEGARGLSCLVLVNGREVSALQGPGTRVKPGDKVVFVPVVHGG